MDIVDYYEAYIHGGIYYTLLAIMPLLEMVLPLRTNKYPLPVRWLSNILLGIIDGLMLKFLFPIAGIAFAVYVHQQGWGLFNLFDVPAVLAIILSILIYDFSKYILHRLYHHIPLLWAFHKIHHSDPDYDFTTSFRFHPLETLTGAINTFVLILLLGMPVLSLIIFEVALITINFFVHTNIKLPAAVEKTLRLLCVTPDMHRIHHSAHEPHTNSNYSIIFPYWDYLVRTYTPVASVNQATMTVGLLDCQGKKHLNIFWLLLLPFLPNKRQPSKS